MNKDKLENILAELYEYDPRLKIQANELRAAVKNLLEARPEINLDQAMLARIRNQVMQHVSENPSGTRQNFPILINLNHMKKIYFGAGVVIILAAFAILAIPGFKKSAPAEVAQRRATHLSVVKNQIAKSAPNAFGNLSGLNVVGMGGAGNEMAAKTRSGIAPMGGSREAVQGSVGSGVAATPLAADSKMIGRIMPPSEYVAYKYVYKGDPIELNKAALPVYKRIKGLDISGLDGLIGGLNLSLVNLGKLQNAKLQNFSLIEDRDYGLNAYVDLIEGNVSLSQNWNKWRNLDMEKCTDEACFAQYRMKYENFPGDNEILSLAGNFLDSMQINLQNYGQGTVDSAWKSEYEKATDKSSVYIPEDVSVIYPFLLDGNEVKDQNGNEYGLRVNVNVRVKKVSGVSALTPNNFESSEYAIETDPAVMIKSAESGGFFPIYYAQDANAKTVEVELGTPKLAYVDTWDYKDGQSSELMVPALIFPIAKIPGSGYFWQKNIVVPLVKEMLDKISQNPVPEPMPLAKPMSAPTTVNSLQK